MNDLAKLFETIGEPYAAGLFEEPHRGYFYRHCLGYARFFEALAPVKYTPGEKLYPCGNGFYGDAAVQPMFALTYTVDWDKLQQKSAEGAAALREFYEISHSPGGWTHAAVNYKRVLKEGLKTYRARVEARPADTAEEKDFREGLLQLLDGMECYVRRSVQWLKENNAFPELISALQRVPFEPAQTYYEGLVAWNMIAYFDGMDNLGCLDDGLNPLYRGEDLTDVIARLFENLNQMGLWSCTVGTNGYSPITEQAVRAIRGKRRPMLELLVREEMPQKLWDLAIENLHSGCTNPSFYNIRGIKAMLHARFPHIPEEELEMFCGCGCTETNLQGISRVGGTDGDMRLLSVFREYMVEHLQECADFDTFFEGVCSATEAAINRQLDEFGERYVYMSKYLPNPVRTLLIDDCIDKGKDYNAGGARYTWAQSSDSGIINTIDSLLAVRELIYRKKTFTAEQFLALLEAEDPAFERILKSCPCYGVDDPDADALATKYATRVYQTYINKPPYDFVEAFTLTEHQFDRYEWAGRGVGPTPDGRKKDAPTNDSIASLRGKATLGPTAMLKSAAKMPQHLAHGISVLNLTLQKSFSPAVLQGLVKSYFALGGIQVQVTCTSVEELKDAMVHPERHEDLIVRVGGYAEYFNRLTPALKQAVLERNIHAL